MLRSQGPQNEALRFAEHEDKINLKDGGRNIIHQQKNIMRVLMRLERVRTSGSIRCAITITIMLNVLDRHLKQHTGDASTVTTEVAWGWSAKVKDGQSSSPPQIGFLSPPPLYLPRSLSLSTSVSPFAS